MAITQDKFLQAGTGAVNRTVESKIGEVVSVKDFGAVGDGVADDTAAIQAALDSTSVAKTVNMSGGVFNIAWGDITIPTGVTLEGDGELLGRVVVGGDDVTVRNIKITGVGGVDANGFNGLSCIDYGNLLVENVTFNLSTVINTNDKIVYKTNYRYLNCIFTGNFSSDAFAATFSVGNLADLFVSGCSFEQTNLYRIIKLTSTGYAVDENVDESFNRKIIFSGNSIAGSMQAASPNDIIDTFSSATKIIFDSNVITTTGGVDVFSSKAGGGTGARTNQHREIIISNNVIRTDVSQVVMTMAGAIGQSWVGEEQNIMITGNQILASNNALTTIIECRAYHRAIVSDNDITYTGTSTACSGIKIRSSLHANISGGFVTGANVSIIGSPTEGEVETLAISGLSIIEGTGRSIDMNAMIGSNVTISGCSIDNAVGVNPIRVKDSTLNYLVTSGNVNENAANGVQLTTATITKHVDVGNIWN